MSAGFWDDAELSGGDGGDIYIKFLDPGDEYKGTIAKLSKRYFDGQDKPAVEITFSDGRVMTVGQWLLKRTLVLIAPAVGDQLEVTYVREERKGSKGTKLFKGTVTRHDGIREDFDHTMST